MFPNQKFKNLLRVLIGLTFIVSTTSCNVPSTKTTLLPFTTLQFPDANYASLIQANGHLIAFEQNWDIAVQNQYAVEGEQKLSQLLLPTEYADCLSKPDYGAYNTFPDGRVQLWMYCLEADGAKTYLLAYDWQKGIIEKIAGPLPLGTSDSTWNPEMTRGVAYLDRGFSTGTLYEISPGSFGPWDFVVRDNGRSWNMKDDFPDFQGSDQGLTGTTERAAWSPDGKTIAFFGSTGTIGMKGRGDAGKRAVEYKIYVTDAQGSNPYGLFGSIYSPFGLTWSPDSKFIAFIGRYGLFQEEGVWLYSFTSNSVKNIAKGRYHDVLWEADGKSLNVIHCPETLSCSEVFRYDLSSIIAP